MKFCDKFDLLLYTVWIQLRLLKIDGINSWTQQLGNVLAPGRSTVLIVCSFENFFRKQNRIALYYVKM